MNPLAVLLTFLALLIAQPLVAIFRLYCVAAELVGVAFFFTMCAVVVS